MVCSAVLAAILPGNPHVPSRPEQLVQGHTVGRKPLAAIQKEHIGPLGLGGGHPLKMIPDIIVRVSDIPA